MSDDSTGLAPQEALATAADPAASWHLDWAAISDVGRVRKNNQDSGYAGPHLLTVCDGVGGAARGDIASATAIALLRRLDREPGSDLLGDVSGAMMAAHVRIGELVDADPDLSGTSTTATLALFDGRRIGIGHIGDSRAYLLRQGQLAQLTHDHTFVQTLIDEGRLTEAEARVHPNRNLILKALDASQDPDPDLSYVNLQPGDRLLLCSDGASGYLTDERIGELLTHGTPEFAAVELTRHSLEAGSTDNVTCVVADVVSDRPERKDPHLVGAAAELPRSLATEGLPGGVAGRVGVTARGGGGRSSAGTAVDEAPLPDLPAGAHAIANDPIDPEAYRYAPRAPERYRWLRRLLATTAVLGVLWVAVAGAWAWSQHQFFVGVHDGHVTIFRGINTEVPGISLSHPYELSDVSVDRLAQWDVDTVVSGIEATDLADARRTVTSFAARQDVP